MPKKRILAFIILVSLLLSACPSHAQLARENPDSLPVRSPYDADRQLALSLQKMFGSLDSFIANINASNFAASRRDVTLFLMSYDNFTEVYRRSNLNGSDMEAIATKLAFMADDLNATIAGSESYSADLEQFREHMDGDDTAGAAQLAARMQVSYRNVSESVRSINANSTHILRMLDRTKVDTSGLEKGIAGLNNYSVKVSDANRKPSGLLGDTSLALAASRSEVASGEHILLSAVLRVSGGMISGRLIRFYVDGAPAGTATTDMSGVGTLYYRVDGSSFNETLQAVAEFDPRGDRLAPSASNVLVIARRPEKAMLQTHVTPRTAACGDTVTVHGSLAAASGVPAAYQKVTILAAGVPAGNVTTGDDGSFSLPLAARHDMPAGECLIIARYESAPGCVLTGTTSTPALLVITPGTSIISLDRTGSAFYGGEKAVFNGTLLTDSGMPVKDAKVSVFAGGALIGECTTDNDGHYSLVTAIPCDITPGEHGIYALFDPGTGMALAGSQSETFPALFRPGIPLITVRGAPLIAFPGDEVNLTGIAMAGDGKPLDGMPVTIRLPGAGAVTAVTDSGGSYQATCKIAESPGFGALSVSVQGGSLLSGAEQGTGYVLVMPFNRGGMALVAILAMLAAGAYAATVADRRRATRTKKPLPRPTVSLQAGPRPGHRSSAFGIEEEIRKIKPALSGEGDPREAMLSIYRITRLMLRDRDPSLPESATHRELYRMLSGRRPSLSTPLDTITRVYENTAFGHSRPTDEEINRSVRSLLEIKGLLYDDRGGSP